MSIFIATGTNLGNKKANLTEAKTLLSTKLDLIAESRIYESPAVDYLNQPDFYNQVLEFSTPQVSPEEIMRWLLELELQMGRNRQIPKGPRLIDLDLIFWENLQYESQILTLPHPRATERSFVMLPLRELPGFSKLNKEFQFDFHFSNEARPISN